MDGRNHCAPPRSGTPGGWVRNVPVPGLETGQRYGTNVIVPHPGSPLCRVPRPCSGLTGEFRTFASESWYHGRSTPCSAPTPVPHPCTDLPEGAPRPVYGSDTL
ncbi:hypothetical protein AG1IA_08382 [Rhizoctonia solani AG-1 IA]|uniref:Uncharacterized protein n=1 Tax=Thanatephorus cucumeris (strain AG1-IA) TaxID=983506 RepID=L8WL92_THACA|nr:hypothetical protein AG1IA_08382 [Rhizoctonia solani AG-1 IA]